MFPLNSLLAAARKCTHAHSRRLTAVFHSARHKCVTAMLYNAIELLVSLTADENLDIGFSPRKYDNDIIQLPLASTSRMRTTISKR